MASHTHVVSARYHNRDGRVAYHINARQARLQGIAVDLERVRHTVASDGVRKRVAAGVRVRRRHRADRAALRALRGASGAVVEAMSMGASFTLVSEMVKSLSTVRPLASDDRTTVSRHRHMSLLERDTPINQPHSN